MKKKGSGQWQELCVPLTDPAFGGRGPLGSDVWITNDDTDDDVFDSLEISSRKAAEIAMAGCSWASVDTLWAGGVLEDPTY